MSDLDELRKAYTKAYSEHADEPHMAHDAGLIAVAEWAMDALGNEMSLSDTHGDDYTAGMVAGW